MKGANIDSHINMIHMLRGLCINDWFEKGKIHSALVKSLRFTRDGTTLLSSRYVVVIFETAEADR